MLPSQTLPKQNHLWDGGHLELRVHIFPLLYYRHTFQRNKTRLEDFLPLLEMLICRGGGEDTLPLKNAPQTCHTAYTYQKESILHQALLHIAVYCEPCEKCAIALESLLTFINVMDPAEADRFGKDLISDPAWGHLGDDSPITIERKALINDAISSHKSLQKMCQVTIAKCLGWQLDEKIHDLPIPKKLMLFPWGIDTPQSSESGSPSRPKKKGRKIRFSPVIIEEQFVERSDATDEEVEEEEEEEKEGESQNDTDSVNKINMEKSALAEVELVKSNGTSHEGSEGENSGKIGKVEEQNVGDSKTEKKNTGQHWDEEFPIEKQMEEDVPETVQNVTDDKLEVSSIEKENLELSENDLINDNKESNETMSDGNNPKSDILDSDADTSDKIEKNTVGKEVGDENSENIEHPADETKGNDENDNELSSDKDSASISLSENSNLDSPVRRLDISLKDDLDLDKSTNFEYEDSDEGEGKGKDQGKNIADPSAKGTGNSENVLCSKATSDQEDDGHSDDTASVD